MEPVFFYFFSGITIVSAVLVLSFRNTLSSAMALIATLFGMACLFALLGAHFLAAMQILVYAGAIMVLFVFIIMLLDLGQDQLKKIKMTFASVVGIALGGYLVSLLIFRLKNLEYPFKELVGGESYGSIKSVGQFLFTETLIPFELTSILLLVAIVGVVVLSKKEDPLSPRGRGLG